jgi:hypothetical protein
VVPHHSCRYPTSHTLEAFAVAINGILASTSELLW